MWVVFHSASDEPKDYSFLDCECMLEFEKIPDGKAIGWFASSNQIGGAAVTTIGISGDIHSLIKYFLEKRKLLPASNIVIPLGKNYFVRVVGGNCNDDSKMLNALLDKAELELTIGSKVTVVYLRDKNEPFLSEIVGATLPSSIGEKLDRLNDIIQPVLADFPLEQLPHNLPYFCDPQEVIRKTTYFKDMQWMLLEQSNFMLASDEFNMCMLKEVEGSE